MGLIQWQPNLKLKAQTQQKRASNCKAKRNTKLQRNCNEVEIFPLKQTVSKRPNIQQKINKQNSNETGMHLNKAQEKKIKPAIFKEWQNINK